MRPGEIVTESVELFCQDCRFVILVGRGARIPPCPCGSSNYEQTSRDETNPSSRRARRIRRALQDADESAA
jgi:hypothetical protein